MKLITEEVQKVQFITEGKGAEKKMFIEGIFLQGDICNRNGRMYPMETLMKEVTRYNESFVTKGRALGELGHPCLSGDAKLLSVADGWKHIQDCDENENVYTLNPKTKEIEVNPIKKVVINHHKGVMYTLKNRGINTKITPDHRFLIINSRNHNDYKFITAQEIYDDLNSENKLSKWYIPRYSLGLIKDSPEYYHIEKSKTLKKITDSTKKYLDDLKIEFNTFAAFELKHDINVVVLMSPASQHRLNRDTDHDYIDSCLGFAQSYRKKDPSAYCRCSYDPALGEDHECPYANKYDVCIEPSFLKKEVYSIWLPAMSAVIDSLYLLSLISISRI
jgi:hypothetical protein